MVDSPSSNLMPKTKRKLFNRTIAHSKKNSQNPKWIQPSKNTVSFKVPSPPKQDSKLVKKKPKLQESESALKKFTDTRME